MKRLFGVLAGALLLLAVPVTAHAQDKGKAKEGASKTMTATGTVKAVSADSLTVTTKTGDETFTVDSKTNVTATGASHKSEAMKGEKKATQITDFVSTGDNVTVRFRVEGATNHATGVRVTKKAAAPKK